MTDVLDSYRSWDQLTESEREQIQADPEHKREDYARRRWKRAQVGDGWTWDKWQDAEVAP